MRSIGENPECSICFQRSTPITSIVRQTSATVPSQNDINTNTNVAGRIFILIVVLSPASAISPLIKGKNEFL